MKDEVERIHTPCKTCIFAKYNGDTQTGCGLGRIQPFREQGSVLEAEDEEKKFYIINGRLCNGFNEPGGEFAKTFAQEDWVETAKKLLKLRLAIIVVIEEGHDLQMLTPTIESIMGQSLKPKQVIFVNNQKTIRAPEIQTKLWKIIGNSLTWRINAIVERGAGDSFVSVPRAIDHTINSVQSAYYSVFKPGFYIPTSFVEDLNVALNEKMERFSLLLPQPDGNGLTVQTEMHKNSQINGNMPMVYETPDGEKLLTTVEEKICNYATLQEKLYLVKKAKEVCPRL